MVEICGGSSWQHLVVVRTVVVEAGSACLGTGMLPATSGRTRRARPKIARRRRSPDILRRTRRPRRSGTRTPWRSVNTSYLPKHPDMCSNAARN